MFSYDNMYGIQTCVGCYFIKPSLHINRCKLDS